ncbi:MAG: peptidoglycan-associated lipoprotein Pal [Rhodobacteraceae bacterium]|nr:MAG: peptidoglycan-associated lipoprotein Pal [Paracoccaceae bacterium]
MTLTSKALLILAGLALAACNNPRAGGTFGGGGADGFGDTGGFQDAGIMTGNLGDPNDPRSVAHFQQRIGDRVFFTTDSSSLTSEGRATLEAQARWLNQNTQFSIVMEGHADERGTRDYNIALGERRANAAMQYLISQGVSANRMRVVSYGKDRPVEACAAQRCWDVNRRAVTAIAGVTG